MIPVPWLEVIRRFQGLQPAPAPTLAPVVEVKPALPPEPVDDLPLWMSRIYRYGLLRDARDARALKVLAEKKEAA